MTMKAKLVAMLAVGIAAQLGVPALTAYVVYTSMGGLGGIIAAIGASLVTVKVMNETLTPISKALAPSARRP